MKLLTFSLLLLALCLPLAAQQTQADLTQIKGRSSAAGTLFVVLPDGKMAQADIACEGGCTASLDLSGPSPVLRLRFTSPAAASFVDGEVPAQTGALVFTLTADPIAGSLKVFRNGIRQFEGATRDYTLSGRTITFNPWFAGDPNAPVVCDYRK